MKRVIEPDFGIIENSVRKGAICSKAIMRVSILTLRKRRG